MSQGYSQESGVTTCHSSELNERPIIGVAMRLVIGVSLGTFCLEWLARRLYFGRLLNISDYLFVIFG